MAPMAETKKAELAERRRKKKAADEAERAATMTAYKAPTWRRRELQMHVDQVLALSGGERLLFMESNPVGSIFR